MPLSSLPCVVSTCPRVLGQCAGCIIEHLAARNVAVIAQQTPDEACLHEDDECICRSLLQVCRGK